MTGGLRRVALSVAGGTVAAHLLPSIATIPAVHKRLAPALSGISRRQHVALTFDDGPDPSSTPAFLDELDDLNVRATFFVLGTQAAAHPDLARRIVADGHEIAVHGWTHRPHLLRTPAAVHRDIARTRECVRAVTGGAPRFWRPPNGIVTGAGVLASLRLGLRPVLWTADGRDWAHSATAESVARRIGRQLEPGATILLHDSDITSASGSWRHALAALPDVVERCRAHGWAVGTLREHWTA